MSLRNRELERNNRYVDKPWEDVGITRSYSPRADLEDRLIQVLEDCITANPPGLIPVRIDWFREFVRRERYALGWPPAACDQLLWDDHFCVTSLLYWVARLKRMACRQQWACNCLLQLGFPVEALPQGNEEL